MYLAAFGVSVTLSESSFFESIEVGKSITRSIRIKILNLTKIDEHCIKTYYYSHRLQNFVHFCPESEIKKV